MIPFVFMNFRTKYENILYYPEMDFEMGHSKEKISEDLVYMIYCNAFDIYAINMLAQTWNIFL